MNPADNYIADFTKDINRIRVIEVRSIMDNAADASGPELKSTMPIEDALQILINATNNTGVVVDDNGEIIGKVDLDRAVLAIARPDKELQEGLRYK